MPATILSTNIGDTPLQTIPLHQRAGFWGMICIGLISAFLIFSHMDPGGSYPQAGAGPGITQDESFNVQQGYFLVEALSGYGLGILDPQSIKEIFEHPAYLPDHPPLGRFLLGLSQKFVRAVVPPENPQPLVSTVAARFGSGLAYLALIILCGVVSARWYGIPAGIVCMLILLFMPRLRAHGSIAALESSMNLTWMATILAVCSWRSDGNETDQELPSRKRVILSGVLFGLALLTKIQAVLLPVPIILWAFWQWKLRAWKPLAIFGTIGFLIFFVGWPWLWLDPINHSWEYFARAGNRVSLHVFYFGQQWQDNATPWHYPWVMFLGTVPLLWLSLGFPGIFRPKHQAWKSPREQLLLGCCLFPLLLFSIPGVAIYDGVRLFLVVFPLWAMLAARGFAHLWQRCNELECRVRHSVWTVVTCGLFGVQLCWLSFTQPASLSYYNGLVGTLQGASSLGFERTYWGDSLNREFLAEVTDSLPFGSVVAVTPLLHQFYLSEVQTQSPLLQKAGLKLVPFNHEEPAATEHLIVYFRRADLPAELDSLLANASILCEYREQQVLLSALYRLNPK